MNRFTRTRVRKRQLSQRKRGLLSYNTHETTPVRVDILLLISTFLFGVTVQVLREYESMSSDFRGLFLEVSTLLLFSSYLFLLASWSQYRREERALAYEQTAISQLLVLNGILVSLLVSYAVSLIGISETPLPKEAEEGPYILMLLFLFVVLPIWVYSRNPAKTFGTIFGFAPSEDDLDSPMIFATVTMAMFFLIAFTLLLAYSSKLLNVVSMASLFIYLPFIGIWTKEKMSLAMKMYQNSRVRRYLVYSLGIYRVYFFILAVSLVYDYFKSQRDVWILVIALLMLITYGVALFTEKNMLITGMGIILLGISGVSIIYLLFIRNYVLLTGTIFIVYLTFVGFLISFAILTSIAEGLKRKLKQRIGYNM